MDRAVLSFRLTVASLLALLAAAVPASAAAPDVVATGLHDPIGIAAGEGDHGDRLLVAQSGSGELTTIVARRRGESVVSPFAQLTSSAGDVVTHGFRTAFATASGPPEAGGDPVAQIVRVPRGGPSSLLADISTYQVGDPDPADQEGTPADSNPFGLALLHRGLLVADAANNDLLKVGKDGSIKTVARFPTRTLQFPEGIPDGPPPGTPVEAEAVPTAVAVGPDGAWYVSELRGFPFTKGASRIWRIEPGTEDWNCDPDAKRGPCRVFADGFTSVIDLAFAGRTLLVLEIAKEGLLAAESGGGPPVGALWAVKGRSRTEISPGSLLAPGGVAVVDEERIYVTTGSVLGPGAGGVVRIKGAPEDHHHGDSHGTEGKKHKKHRRHRHHKRHRHHRR